MKPTAEMKENTTILKEWLQAKDAIVFTDDIAINAVTNELNTLIASEVDKMVSERLSKWEFISFANYFHKWKEKIQRGECPIRPEEVYNEWVNLKSTK